MAQGKLVFHYARVGNVEALAALLERTPPAPTTYKDSAGDSALHKACLEAHLPCVKLLVEKGADVRALNAELATPLHMAAASGSVECLQQLLEAGVDRDARDNEGRTPLHHAVANRRVDACALLLAYGADMGGTILPGGDLPSWDPAGLFRPVQQLAVIMALSRMSALSALSVSAAKGKLQECLRFLDDPDEPHSRLRALLDERRLCGLQAKASAGGAGGSAAARAGEVVPQAVRALARAEVLLSCAKIAFFDAAIKTAQSLGSAIEGPGRAPLRAHCRRRRSRGSHRAVSAGGGSASGLSSEEDAGAFGEGDEDGDDAFADDDEGFEEGDGVSDEEGAARSKRQRKAVYAAVMCVGRWGRMLKEQEDYSREAEYAARYLEQARG